MENPTSTSVSYCRSCGKQLQPEDQKIAGGIVYCAEHAPAASTADSPWTATPSGTGVSQAGAVSPGLAFILGLIPGVGAIYNGQYAKGLIHVVIFGTLISIANSHEIQDMTPVFVLMSIAWVPYMAFEAYHTALRRLNGGSPDEFSSIFPMKNNSQFPIGPVLLMTLGIFFLLNNFEIVRFYQIVKFWPVALIAAGAYMLFERSQAGGAQ
jgi:Domain of unknown function (DUF5668)